MYTDDPDITAGKALGSFEKADDNVVQGFALVSSSIRGRAVRLGDCLHDVLEPHDYPEPVAHMVGEVMAAALLLSSMLKFDGIFTLQAKGDGPVSMLVADVTSDGEVRGCASYDEERFQASREQLSALKTVEGSQNHLAQYLGKGYIAFTVDQGDAQGVHQGIVDLNGSSLVDCVQHYFSQSEQIGTGIKMAVGKRDGQWRAGGIMLQHMPEDEINTQAGSGNLDEDDWRRAMILLDSCSDNELLDPELHSNMLLTRLFHEEGVRVFSPLEIKKSCRCSASKVENVLFTMPPEDLDHMAVDGEISMRCKICGHDDIFELKDSRRKIGKQESANADD